MALAAARTFFDTPDAALENVEIRTPVVFQPQQAKLFRLVIEPRTATFTIETRDRMSNGAWTLNVTGRMLESGNTLGDASVVPSDALDRLLTVPAADGDTLYANTAAIGLSYGRHSAGSAPCGSPRMTVRRWPTLPRRQHAATRGHCPPICCIRR